MEEKKNINKSLLSDDELVAMFFDENRQELPDNGFSQRVMHTLPSRSVWLSRIWTAACLLAGVVFFVWADGLGQLRHVLMNSMGNFFGFLSSVSFSGISPVMVVAVAFVFWATVAWNFLVEWKEL
ncbi:MAG: DUF5056 domain-containing protein [Prevotella sp.]|nr:DUF5056 domain-containing protein [Prevotella sp.]